MESDIIVVGITDFRRTRFSIGFRLGPISKSAEFRRNRISDGRVMVTKNVLRFKNNHARKQHIGAAIDGRACVYK